MSKLDHPLVYALVIMVIVLALAHIMHWALLAAHQPGAAGFFSLP